MRFITSAGLFCAQLKTIIVLLCPDPPAGFSRLSWHRAPLSSYFSPENLQPTRAEEESGDEKWASVTSASSPVLPPSLSVPSPGVRMFTASREPGAKVSWQSPLLSLWLKPQFCFQAFFQCKWWSYVNQKEGRYSFSHRSWTLRASACRDLIAQIYGAAVLIGAGLELCQPGSRTRLISPFFERAM